MQRVAGMDGMYFGMDASGSSSGVIGGLFLYRPSDDPEAASLSRLRARLRERLDAIPPLRWVRAGNAVGVNNYYWVDADEVDIDAHTRERAVPAPGDLDALLELLVALDREPLDPDRPLWEFTVLTGLADGRRGHYIRLHHSMLDGTNVLRLIDLICDEPIAQAHPDDARTDVDALRPGALETAARGLVTTVFAPARLGVLTVKTAGYLLDRTREEGVAALPAFVGRVLPGRLGAPLRELANVRQRMRGGREITPVFPTVTQRTSPFSGRITTNRTLAIGQRSVQDLKELRRAFGVTLNDVVVAACAGALRAYEQALGATPVEPIVVAVPYSIRTGRERERWANHLGVLMAELPIHLADPAERVRVVHEQLVDARTSFDSLPVELLREASTFVPQTFWRASIALLQHSPDWVPSANWNVVVSNLRGPDQQVHICGAPLEGYWPAPFLTPGIGLNITFQTYADTVCFGFMACPDLVPHARDLPALLDAAIDELYAARPA